MSRFQQLIARFDDFSGLCNLRWLPVFAALAAVAAPLSAALAFRRPAVAGFQARSIAPGRLRSMFRSAHPGRVAAAASPAPMVGAHGTASSPAIAAAAPGGPRGTERLTRSPDFASLRPDYEK